MITAHKYLNLDASVINISALIINELKENKLLKHDELLNVAINIIGEQAKDILPYALNLLFLLNKISYTLDLDAFQLNEAE